MLKRKRLTFELVSKGILIFEKIPIQEVEVTLFDVLELCDCHSIYAYDAYYLQLAKKASIPLLTLDQKMASVAKQENIQIKEIL